MNFIFECLTQYLTSARSERARYEVEHAYNSGVTTICVITFCVMLLHFAVIVITFCVSITFCGDCYILRGNTRLFFEYLTFCHPNIKFTMETEEKDQLPFLDALLSKQCQCSPGLFSLLFTVKRLVLVCLLIILDLPPLNIN